MPSGPPHEEPGYRLCYVNMPGLMGFEGDKDYHGNPTFSGASKEAMDLVVEIFFNDNYWNHTMVSSNKLSSQTDNGGCIGSLHRNESDIILSMVVYPTSQSYETVDPYAVLFEEPLAIVSRYNDTVEIEHEDIFISASKVFTLDLWLSLMVTFAVISFIWFLGNRRQRRKENPLFAMFSLFMNQNSLISSSMFRKIFAIVLSFGFFVVFKFFGNMLKTDMVVAKRPIMFDSLENIMSRPETIPSYVALHDTYRVFKFAENDSIKKTFWDRYAYLEASRKIFLDLTNPGQMINQISESAQGRSVIIMNRLWVSMTTSSSCKLGVESFHEKGRMLSTTIFPDEVYQVGVVRNARLRTTNYGRFMRKQVINFFETGNTALIRKEFARGVDLQHVDYESFRKCMIDTYSDPDVHVYEVSIGNFKNVMLFYVACILIGILSLEIQKVIRKPNSQKSVQ